jgi:hypothetical protein
MSMSAMIQAMGAVAGGVSSGMDAAEAAAERKRKRDADAEDRAFTMSERTRAVNMRQDMGNAAAEVVPVEVKQDRPETMDNRDVGQPGEAPLPTAGYDVGGKRFTDRTQATAAATEQNTPQAVTARMADVQMRNGEPLKAQQLRTGAMTEQATKYQLNDAERLDITAKFNTDLQASVKDWDSLDKFVSDSAGDGQGGKIKIKSVVSADGKTRVVNVIAPDGTLTPTGKVIPNTPDGLALAKAELARMPVQQQLAHLHQKDVLARQVASDANTATYQQGMLKATQDRTAAGIEIAQVRAEASAQRRAGADQAGGMTLADLKDGHKGIASTLNSDWKTQIESETDPTKLKALKVARESEVATVQRLYTGAMTAGFGLTPEQAIVAFRSGEARTGTVDAPGGGKMNVEGIVYGGRFIPLAGNPGATPPAAAEPASPSPSKKDNPPAVKPATMAEIANRPRTPNLDPSLTGDQRGTAHREVMRTKIPDAQKAFDDAKAAFESAKDKGPMPAANARYAMTKARAALAEAKAKAGM